MRLIRWIATLEEMSTTVCLLEDPNGGYIFGIVLDKASPAWRWELGVMTQRVETDALFAQWFDSHFAWGLADNRGEAYRFGWMLTQKLLLNLAYYDTQFDVEVESLRYRHSQLDLNFTF